ncbi:MAG: hypothetical protein OSB41_06450 [Kiritimatiellae bacterium]|nr:hypothetical protein [Kiritimatiellia bacterium]
MPNVDIYYARVCGLCTEAVDWLRSRDVTFTAYAVQWDNEADAFVDTPTAQEMHRRCGQTVDFVPQIFIGERHIAGWKKLKPMIESGEIDALIPKID